MSTWEEEVATTSVEARAKMFRKWAFTINCDLLNDKRLNESSFYIEGQDVSVKTNDRNKTVRTTVWIGALEPKEVGKRDNYNHRHCAVENTSGSITKMNALTILSEYLNIPVGTLTCGLDCVVPYSQPVNSWIDYKKYMFKTLPGRKTSDEEKIQESVTKLRRSLKQNPTPKQVKEYLVQNSVLSFRKVASGMVSKMIDLACDIADVYKSSSSEDGEDKEEEEEQDGLKFLSKLSKLDANTSSISAGFFDDILPLLIRQLMDVTRGGDKPTIEKAFEVAALMLMPLILKRHIDDHQTPSLVLYGKTQTGKSFIPMSLVKATKLHLIATDAKGVGRFEANSSCNGFFFDDINYKTALCSTDTPTIKNLTCGDEATIKIYGKTAPIRGWLIMTSQGKLRKEENDEGAWQRRLIELDFEQCTKFKTFVTAFDMTKRSNIDEILTFLYWTIHRPIMNELRMNYGKCLIKTEYYDATICAMFDKLKYGQNLLRVLNHVVVNIKKNYV